MNSMNYDHVIGKQIEITQIIEAIEDTYMNLGGTTYRVGVSILNIIGVDNNSIHLSLEHIYRTVYEYSLSESMFELCETIAELIYDLNKKLGKFDYISPNLKFIRIDRRDGNYYWYYDIVL